MIDQGSYKYNTTIKDEVVDRDVAVIIPLSISDNEDPRKIKGYLKDATISSRTVFVKEPCVRASYFDNGKEWMHIDLPLYAQDGDEMYLARGKVTSTVYSWENADPDELNEYICGEVNGNNQLRCIICFIKKWKNEKYANSVSDHEAPPSIGLTLLAIDKFSEQSTEDGDNDLLSLYKTMKAILEKIIVVKDDDDDIVSASLSCYLPVTPYTDVFTKMKNSRDTYMVTFYKRLKKAVENLKNALNVDNDHDAGVYVQKVLGSEFDVPAKKAVAAVTQNNREHSFG